MNNTKIYRLRLTGTAAQRKGRKDINSLKLVLQAQGCTQQLYTWNNKEEIKMTTNFQGRITVTNQKCKEQSASVKQKEEEGRPGSFGDAFTQLFHNLKQTCTPKRLPHSTELVPAAQSNPQRAPPKAERNLNLQHLLQKIAAPQSDGPTNSGNSSTFKTAPSKTRASTCWEIVVWKWVYLKGDRTKSFKVKELINCYLFLYISFYNIYTNIKREAFVRCQRNPDQPWNIMRNPLMMPSSGESQLKKLKLG
jgi:hypothetical protein